MRQGNEAPLRQADKGKALHHCFRVSMCLPWNASMKKGGKNSLGRFSKAEKAKVSFLSRFFPARSRSLGGFQTFVLTLQEKESSLWF